MKNLNLLCLMLLIGFGVCLINDFDTEEIENLIKEKCENNGAGEEAFEAFMDQQSDLPTCLGDHINVKIFQDELEESKKRGAMDEVFGKYCRKYPEIYTCIEAVTDKLKPCLDSKEEETMNKTLQIVGTLKDFICRNDGDFLALFIAEQGVECFKSRKEQLQECVNKTIGAKNPTDLSVNSLSMFLITDKECNDFDKVGKCIVKELEMCENSTPANVAWSLFRFLKNYMPCRKNVKSSTSATTVTLFVVGFSFLFSKFL
ncbi:hypothetical protein Zmor_026204 [Zophobas morio]|uniref:27 kDa hemolymph protein n=1 Tax=Zophobas morio TaxID=2755281 RepID=A0AA38HUY5_9CUCU|nr:hypothetical protein Zmor_026204 [Zophobas morio]